MAMGDLAQVANFGFGIETKLPMEFNSLSNLLIIPRVSGLYYLTQLNTITGIKLCRYRCCCRLQNKPF